MDSAGRLVLPKAIREEAGVLPGVVLHLRVHEGKIEIEPAPREVKIVQKGPLRIAESVGDGPKLGQETVDQVLGEIRGSGR